MRVQLAWLPQEGSLTRFLLESGMLKAQRCKLLRASKRLTFPSPLSGLYHCGNIVKYEVGDTSLKTVIAANMQERKTEGPQNSQ